MTGWEVSRHPEWDLMYAAGLTVREISDRCHVGVATIHAHFQSRERYEPGTRARHEAALANRNPDRPTVQWRRRLSEAVNFLEKHGHLPRSSGDQAEVSLHAWLSSQRRSFQRGQMSNAKTFLLEQLYGWQVDARQEEYDGLWRGKLKLLSAFVQQHGGLPRHHEGNTKDEKVLLAWLQVQRQRLVKGTLFQWREDALDAAVPGWRGKQ